MSSQKIFIIEPQTSEEARALNAFADAMKLKYKISTTDEIKSAILTDLEASIKELNLIKKGKVERRNVQDLLDEL